MKDLRSALADLQSIRDDLEKKRYLGALENDVFEAVDDLCHLATRAVETDTKVNYPARAREEYSLWTALSERIRRHESEILLYTAAVDSGVEILKFLLTIQPPADGHLGVLRIVKAHFGFLLTDYRFTVKLEEPTGYCFSSGEVYLNIGWATTPDLSCSFGPESQPELTFWINDLLFLYGDSRYATVPEKLNLTTEREVQHWIKFLSSVFREYGSEVLLNQRGIFERLRDAQNRRDQEFQKLMDESYGK
jgi:hypothetical protein